MRGKPEEIQLNLSLFSSFVHDFSAAKKKFDAVFLTCCGENVRDFTATDKLSSVRILLEVCEMRCYL